MNAVTVDRLVSAARRHQATLGLARPLLRAQLGRATIRAAMAVAALVAAWLAWSPGTRFGLGGVYGGWRFVAERLFDVGLVPLAVVGALAGAAPREHHLDEFLHLAGVPRSRVVGAVSAVGAALAALTVAAFAVGAGVGGWVRAQAVGGSWWAAPDASAGLVTDAVADFRLLLGAVLVGALAALAGWAVGHEGRAVALAVVATAVELPEVSVLLGRLPVTIDLLAVSPVGSVRALTLADRGLAAPGYARPTSSLPFALMVIGWCAALIVVAMPRLRRVPAPTASTASTASMVAAVPAPAVLVGRSAATRWAGGALLVAVTLAFGALVPGRAAEALPWRWQRSWRLAEQRGWSSPQTVDQFVAAVRSDPSTDHGELLDRPDAVAAAVVGSLPRADRVDRQPVATMAGPDHVLVRLHFANGVTSGPASFNDYLVRFTLRPDGDQRWRIVGAEGPVAAAGAPGHAGDGW